MDRFCFWRWKLRICYDWFLCMREASISRLHIHAFDYFD